MGDIKLREAKECTNKKCKRKFCATGCKYMFEDLSYTNKSFCSRWCRCDFEIRAIEKINKKVLKKGQRQMEAGTIPFLVSIVKRLSDEEKSDPAVPYVEDMWRRIRRLGALVGINDQ